VNADTIAATEYLVPYQCSQYFTGRTEHLEKISEALMSTRRQGRVAIHGMSGAGKTQLAIKYAEDSSFHYETVFFVDASSEDNIIRRYKEFHTVLTLRETTEEDKVEQVKQWFTKGTSSSWLLIFDGANQLPNLNLVSYIPSTHGHIIITTQDHRVENPDLVKSVIHLDMLSDEESMELLKKSTRTLGFSNDEDIAAKETARRVGNHPLALATAAAWVLWTEGSFSGFLQALGRENSKIFGPSEWIGRKWVYEYLNLNYRTLESKNPQAFSLLLLFAYLDNTEIPRELFEKGIAAQARVGVGGEPFDQKPEQGGVDDNTLRLLSDQPAFRKAIQSLLSFSFINQKRQDPGHMFANVSLHPLTHTFLRLQLDGEQKRKVVLQTLGLVTQAFPSHFFWERFRNFRSSRYASYCSLETDLPNDGNRIHEFVEHSRLRFLLLPHLRACCANLEEITAGRADQESLALFRSESNKAIEVTALKQAISSFIEAYYIEINSRNTSWTRRFMKLVGELLQANNDPHLAVLWLQNQCSLLYKEGNYRRAIELSKEFLDTYCPQVFDRTRQSAESLSSEPRLNAEIGYVLIKYAELLVTEGAKKEALLESFRLLMLCRLVVPGSPSTAERVMLSERDRIVAKGFKDAGRWKEAAHYFQIYCEDSLFQGTPQEGWARADWAQVLLEDGRNAKAQQVIEEQLRARLSDEFIKLSQFATRANDTLLLQINLSEARLRQGFFDDARTQLDGVLARMLEFSHLDHAERTRVFSIYCSLARIAHLQGQWARAKEYWVKAFDYGMDIRYGSTSASWGRGHFYQTVVLLSLADVQYELGDVEGAEALRREVKESGNLQLEKRMYWMLGLGTYWLRFIEEKMEQRDGLLEGK
jgi:NB-ARC domain